jgi:hypothetical protein
MGQEYRKGDSKMSISSLNPEIPADDLHAIAVGFSSVKEANMVLQHPNCSESTRQMVVAKLHLFDQKEFGKIDDNYHSDIVAVTQQRFGSPTATATG